MSWVCHLTLILCLLAGAQAIPYGSSFVPQSTSSSSGDPWLAPARKMFALTQSSESLHYMVEVQMGKLQQDINVVLDTGSTDLMLWNKHFCQISDATTTPPHESDNCFDLSASSSGSIISNLTTVYGLHIDGEIIYEVYPKKGFDSFQLTATIVGTSATDISSAKVNWISVGTDFNIISGADPLHSFTDADGILGLGYQSLSQAVPSPIVAFLETVLEDSEESYEPTFSLDFGENDGELHLGGIEETYRDSLIWSDANIITSTHSLQIHDLTICGVDILTEPISMVVDTGSSCLSFTPDIFDAIVSWIPVTCNDDTNVCYLVDDAVAVLPTLDFTISDGGQTLYLDLADLLLPESGGDQRLCLHRSSSSSSVGIIGALVLKSFYATFVMSEGRIGLANQAATSSSDVQCALRKQCKGMQTLYEPLNMCVDPNCWEYYFFELNNDSKECELTSSFHITATLLILFFAGVEIGLHECQRRLTQKVYSSVRLSELRRN